MVEKVAGWKAADGKVYATLVQAAGAELQFFMEQAWAKLPSDPNIGAANVLTKAMMAFPQARAVVRKALDDYEDALKQAAQEDQPVKQPGSYDAQAAAQVFKWMGVPFRPSSVLTTKRHGTSFLIPAISCRICLRRVQKASLKSPRPSANL